VSTTSESTLRWGSYTVPSPTSWGPHGLRSVQLPYQPSAPIAVYEEFFRAPASARSGQAALRIPAALLGQPLKGSGNLHLR
jgi:hypothetical protein